MNTRARALAVTLYAAALDDDISTFTANWLARVADDLIEGRSVDPAELERARVTALLVVGDE